MDSIDSNIEHQAIEASWLNQVFLEGRTSNIPLLQ